MVLRKSFYIHWSAGRSPRVHEVNPGRGLSTIVSRVNDTHIQPCINQNVSYMFYKHI